MPHCTANPPAGLSRARLGGRPAADEALLREAEAQRALAELFPHLQPDALRAIQALFPLARRSEPVARELASQ
jgi:hypothetical protein